MIYIQHRQNTFAELKELSPELGAEVDLRADVDRAGRIFTAHDPYSAQEDFARWLKLYSEKKMTGPLILNTKVDLIEDYLFEALKKNHVGNFLFLDTAIPTLIRYSQTPQAAHFMLRLSAYESLDFCLQFKGKMKWLWVDCFSAKPLEESLLRKAAQDFKLCLVSPELQGADLKSHLDAFLPLIPHCHAICTKHVDLWKSRLEK